MLVDVRFALLTQVASHKLDDVAHLIFTADLHLGITHAATIERLVETIARREPDAVILAGDLGEPLRRFEDCLDLFADLRCPVGVVAGNHDVWVTAPQSAPQSRDLFDRRLPAAVRRRKFTWLEDDNLLLPDGVAVAGSVGWYDYSYRVGGSSCTTWTDAQMAAAKASRNNDANYIDWKDSDPAFAREVREHLLARVARLEADPAVREIVVATHVPAFVEQMVPLYQDDPVTSSYFCHPTLGRELRKFAKVGTVVSGHTHRGVTPRKLRRGRRPGLTIATVDSEYGAPGWLELFA